LSTLGKILTVLVVLVAVGVAVSVTIAVVLSDNWKARYNDEVGLYKMAMDAVVAAETQRDAEKNARAEERRALQVQVTELTTKVAELNASIAAAKLEKENQEARLQTLTTQYTGLNTALAKAQADLDEARKESSLAKKSFDDVTHQNEQLDVRLRTALKDLDSAKEMIRQTAAGLAAETSKVQYLIQTFPEVKLPTAVPPIPPEKIRGLVTRVDNESKVITINLGQDDGVVAGMKFYVYNGAEMKYLATLMITMVSKDSAAGQLEVIRGTVKVNDHVTNRFE